MSIHVLYEAPLGLLLFRVDSESALASPPRLVQLVEAGRTDVLKLVSRHEFGSLGEAASYLEATARLDPSKGRVPAPLATFLKRELDSGRLPSGTELLVGTARLGQAVGREFPSRGSSPHVIPTWSGPRAAVQRLIRERLTELLAGVPSQTLQTLRRGLSLRHARYTLRLAPGRVDTLVVRSIRAYDDLEKQINSAAVRVREWYSWHFPELSALVPDPLRYAETVLRLGRASRASEAGLSDPRQMAAALVGSESGEGSGAGPVAGAGAGTSDPLLAESVGRAVIRASLVTIGTAIEDEDLAQIQALCRQVLSLAQARSKLKAYLTQRLDTLAPNLVHLVGPLVAARLIAHAGSLRTLAKHPASTVQLYGAEKALFQAFQRNGPTPKYGLLYHTQLVGKAHPRDKGRFARILAAKLVLAARVDALSPAELEKPRLSLAVQARATLLGSLARSHTAIAHRATRSAARGQPNLKPYDHRQVHTRGLRAGESRRPQTYRTHSDALGIDASVRRITVRKSDLLKFGGISAEQFDAYSQTEKKALAKRYQAAHASPSASSSAQPRSARQVRIPNPPPASGPSHPDSRI